MGLYLNPGNDSFARIVTNDIYVDKTGLIAYTNDRIGKTRPYVASSRPRRFGKTLAAQMLAAYYSKGCDSRSVFENLEIAHEESFAEHLNKYDVIKLDIQWMWTSAIPEIKKGNYPDFITYIHSEVIRELREEYPEYVNENAVSLAKVLADFNVKTGKQFVIIVDEWDCIFREDKDNVALQKDYIAFLRSLFKGDAADAFIKLAYITGILPIKKYGNHSALNNFREKTMVAPDGIAQYIGFTEDEVKTLCEQNRASFAKMQRWYDGYIFDQTDDLADDREFAEDDDFACNDETELAKARKLESEQKNQNIIMHVYSPNSVMEALNNRKFQNYWSQTETYESLKIYITMDFDGLKQKVVNMLGGARCKIDVESFQNDMTTFDSSDDVLTLLIHLGYLAYESETQEAFIPNEEVRSTFVRAVKSEGWGDVYTAIQESEKLLAATLAMDETTVAKMIQNVHMESSSSLVYNNEISLVSVIQVAYYTAGREYTLIRELPAGEGFADMVFLPKRRSKKPALIVELKWDKSVEGAIDQIKNKKYVAALKEYKGNMLLVGINYDKKTKKHQCRIETYEMQITGTE